jgi:hypothetical protein
MKEIPLSQGKVALVDDDIYDVIGHLKWYANFQHGTWYALTCLKKKNVTMHHCVMGFPLNRMKIDHIDGNGLNNQKNNLRIVTNRNNTLNRKLHREGRLPGCYMTTRKSGDKILIYWLARMRIGKNRINLGYYKTEQEAHEAYLNELKRRS